MIIYRDVTEIHWPSHGGDGRVDVVTGFGAGLVEQSFVLLQKPQPSEP